MYRRIKKTALILAFLVCFINYQGFAGGLFDKSKRSAEEENSKIDAETTRLKGEIDRLTIEIDKLKRGTGTQEQNRESPSQPALNTIPVTSRTIPVTPRIVEYLLQKDGSSDVLKFYLSMPFTMKIYEQNETAEIEIINNMVILNPPNPANEKVIEFLKDSEGILTEFSGPGADKGSEIKILFQEQGKTLVFKRDRQQNCYLLSSVIINDRRPYEINPSEPIQLCVAGESKRPTEVMVVSADFEYSDSQQSHNYNYAYNASYNSSANSSRRIMGSGSISPAQVKEYVRTKKNLTNRDIAIIDKYFEEARFEGVNVDIAIAQMLYCTNNLRNERVATNNYGGLSRIGNFNGRFDDMTMGIRAHIQHLKGYAKEYPIRNIVDPRFSLAFERGFRGISFDQVYAKWSENSRYGQNIENRLRDLYRF
jgi:hypothetical protein